MLLSTNVMTDVADIAPSRILGVTEDGGVSFWNRSYLERYHAMATRMGCFKQLNRQIFSLVDSNPDALALELGCGSGRNIPSIAKALAINIGDGNGHDGKIYAIDFSLEALKLANENLGDPSNVLFKKDNIKQLSFDSNEFDVLFDIFAGCYAPSKGWRTGLKEAFRVLKPGGSGYFLYFLHGMNFGECFKRRALIELVTHPIGLFWAIHLKLVRGLNIWDKFIERGEIVYPTARELVDVVSDAGGKIEIAERAFLGTCLLVKARK